MAPNIPAAERAGLPVDLDRLTAEGDDWLTPEELRTDCILECPWHGSAFDTRSGEVLQGPARKAVKTYPAKVENGMVYVSIP